jgi:hypothetical protein
MPPFVFQPYDNRGTIAEILGLMQDRGRIGAEQARTIGDAQARSAEISGRAWGQTAGTIGGLIAGIPGQIEHNRDAAQERQLRAAQIRDADQQAQLRGGEIAQQQRGLAGQQVLSQAVRQFTDPQTGEADNQKIAAAVSAAGFPDHANAWLKIASSNDEALGKIRESGRAEQQRKLQTLGDLAFTATSPEDFTAAVGLAATHDLIPKEQVQPLAAAAEGDDWQQVRQQLLQFSPRYQAQQADLDKVREIPADGSLGNARGAIFARGAGKNIVVGPDSSVVNDQTGASVYTGPGKAPDLQSKSMLVDGQPREVTFDPKTGVVAIGGQPIDPSRVKPIPPASITIQQQSAGLQLPSWALDESRPAGAEANKPDPTIGMTPNGLYQSAVNYIQNGQMPQTGRAGDPRTQLRRDAVTNKAGAIAAAAGMDIPTLRAFFKSNAASLGSVQKMADAVQSFMATADKNVEALQPLLAKIPDTGSPLFNQPLRGFLKNVAGDENLSKVGTYLQSVTNEYGRIISQPNLSGQLTDSARQEAGQLLEPRGDGRADARL